jgi:type I restriction enzyme S subunit
MALNRQTVRLSDLCVAVVDCEHKTAPIQPFGIPSIRTANISNGRLDLVSANKVSEATYREWSARLEPRPGDIILAREAPVGDVGIIPEGERVCLGQRTVLLRADEGRVLPHYLLYMLLSPEVRHSMSSKAEGSTVAHLNVADIRSLRVPEPPSLKQQELAAGCLRAVDDKIALNRKMNRTLEAMARALFKSWFVDFDPVRARSEGRAPTGMDAETADLFPDAFVDSAIGLIPKGWRVGVLGEVVGVNERSITKGCPHEVIDYIDIASVSQGVLQGTTKYRLDDAPSRARRLVRSGDTIWSTVRPNRKSYLYIHAPTDNLVVSTGFAVLASKEVPPSFLYSWVTADAFVDYLAFNADGSAYPAVLPGRFASAPMLIPCRSVLNAFADIVGPLRTQIAWNGAESITLAATRDVLLPKVMSGDSLTLEPETGDADE